MVRKLAATLGVSFALVVTGAVANHATVAAAPHNSKSQTCSQQGGLNILANDLNSRNLLSISDIHTEVVNVYKSDFNILNISTGDVTVVTCRLGHGRRPVDIADEGGGAQLTWVRDRDPQHRCPGVRRGR